MPLLFVLGYFGFAHPLRAEQASSLHTRPMLFAFSRLESASSYHRFHAIPNVGLACQRATLTPPSRQRRTRSHSEPEWVLDVPEINATANTHIRGPSW